MFGIFHCRISRTGFRGFLFAFGLLGALDGGECSRRRIAGRMRPANSIFTCCPCRGRRHSAKRRRSAAAADVRRPNAAGGRFPSWSMGCGRNTSAAFPKIAKFLRRVSITAS